MPEKPPTSRRKGFSFVGALDRFIEEATTEKFPIRRRRRDCDRVGFIADTLNTLHATGQVNELRKYIAQLAGAAAEEETFENQAKTPCKAPGK